MGKVRGLLSKRDVKIKDSSTRDFVWQQLSYRANLKSTVWVCVGYFKLQQFWWVVLSFFFVQEVGRKPLRTFPLGYQKQQNGPEYFPLWVIYVLTSWYIATCFHLRNRQTHDLETNQFFLLDHRWLSYHGRNGALKRQRCWPSRAGIYSRLCLAGYAKNPGKSWFVKGFCEVELICPAHCLTHWRTGIESRLACSADGVVWRARSLPLPLPNKTASFAT